MGLIDGWEFKNIVRAPMSDGKMEVGKQLANHAVLTLDLQRLKQRSVRRMEANRGSTWGLECEQRKTA